MVLDQWENHTCIWEQQLNLLPQIGCCTLLNNMLQYFTKVTVPNNIIQCCYSLRFCPNIRIFAQENRLIWIWNEAYSDFSAIYFHTANIFARIFIHLRISCQNILVALIMSVWKGNQAPQKRTKPQQVTNRVVQDWITAHHPTISSSTTFKQQPMPHTIIRILCCYATIVVDASLFRNGYQTTVPDKAWVKLT